MEYMKGECKGYIRGNERGYQRLMIDVIVGEMRGWMEGYKMIMGGGSEGWKKV